MKKILLTVWITGISVLGYAQFIPGNLIVVQATNEGTGPLPTSAPFPAPKVSLVEFNKTGGTPVSSLDFPSTGVGRVVLGNGTGLSTFEGFLKLSSDSNYVTFGGFDADVNTSTVYTTTSATIPRLIISVDKNKVIKRTPTSATSGTYLRYVAAKNENEVYIGGDAKPISYLNLPTLEGGAGTNISTPSFGSINGGIFYGKLYYSNPRVAGVICRYPDLPTIATTPDTLIQRAAGFEGNVTDFILFDTDADNNPDLAYIGTDGTITGNANRPVLYKCKLEDAGGTPTWVAKGSFMGPAELTSHARKVQGITGYKKPDGTYVIYYSTFSSIVSFVDSALPSETMTGTPTVIASAPTRSIFRGISFTPGTTPNVLPVKLVSFDGKTDGGKVQLNWSTASENNNSHFEILRSEGNEFLQPIAVIPGAGNAQTANNYSYIDNSPFKGTNYYQLKQVDFDGKTQKSKIITVNTGIDRASFRLNNLGGELYATVYSENNSSATIKITDVNGRVISETNLKLQKGQNSVQLKAPVATGIYIATLYSEGRTQSLKFRL